MPVDEYQFGGREEEGRVFRVIKVSKIWKGKKLKGEEGGKT